MNRPEQNLNRHEGRADEHTRPFSISPKRILGWLTPQSVSSLQTDKMPSQQAYDVFRDLMKMLMTKTKKQLLEMAMEPDCPDFIQELIMTHPALLGKDVLDYKERESRENDPFVKVTEDIIRAHGFTPPNEWEYECDLEHKPQCLRIWLGKKRTKKNLRVLKLTDEETARVQDLLKAETTA